MRLSSKFGGEKENQTRDGQRQRHRYRDRTSGYVSFSLDFFL